MRNVHPHAFDNQTHIKFWWNNYFLIDLREDLNSLSSYLIDLSWAETFNILALKGVTDLKPDDFKTSWRCYLRTLL